MVLLKRLAARLPHFWQFSLRRVYYGLLIRAGRFTTTEPEYALLPTLVAPGNCVIDVGANIGIYTKRFAELVGKDGRVIAFEPVPETFALLTANASRLGLPNTTLMNAALSDKSAFFAMAMPTFKSGLKNFYQARLVREQARPTEGFQVMTLCLDALHIPQRVALVKIDVEGHEAFVLRGMADLLHRDHPTLIVETNSPEVEAQLCRMGYEANRLDGSVNILFRYNSQQEGAGNGHSH